MPSGIFIIMINIVVWNARGIKEKREEITKNIKEWDIFAITESKIDQYYSFNISGYSGWTVVVITVGALLYLLSTHWIIRLLTLTLRIITITVMS